MDILVELPIADAVAKIDVRRLTNLMKRASHGRSGRLKAVQLKKAAKHSFADSNKAMLFAMEVQFTVQRLNLLIEQIGQLQNQLSKLAEERQELLRLIPGVDLTWEPLILGEILPVFHPDDKDGARALVAYVGLDSITNIT